MFKKALLRSALVLITFLTACGRILPATNAPQPLPSPGESWTIKLTQSGGFAGVMQTLEITSDGQLKAEDQRSGRSVTQKVAPGTMTELTRLYAKAPRLTAPAPHSGCADCFIYDLEVRSDGNVRSIQADDTTLADSGAADLIAFLREIRDRALQAAP